MINSYLRAVYDQTLLSPLSLVATVSVWQHLLLVWVKVKYSFYFEEESSIFTMHLSRKIVLRLQRNLYCHTVNEV